VTQHSRPHAAPAMNKSASLV